MILLLFLRRQWATKQGLYWIQFTTSRCLLKTLLTNDIGFDLTRSIRYRQELDRKDGLSVTQTPQFVAVFRLPFEFQSGS